MKTKILFALLTICFFYSCGKNADSVTPNTPTTPTGNATSFSTDISKIVQLAEAFKATLNSSQLASLQLSYTKTDAVKWSNLPQALVQTKRVGLAFSTLSAEQLTAAKALIAVITGTKANEGFVEAMGILAADDYLNANGGGSTYGSGNYYMAFLGTPSTSNLWELQFGGHHLAIANTYNAGKLTGATPSFRSTEPFPSFTQSGNTYAPIQQEKVALSAALASLSATEANTAKLADTYKDLLLGPGKDGQFPTNKSGIKIGTLNASQKALILAAIKTYVDDLDDISSAEILAKYNSELDETYLSYSGTTTLDSQNDYIRIDGPSVWIEYSTQGGIVIRTANHPHSVWRDRTGDYGGN